MDIERWRAALRERSEARASEAYARLGSNRVPDVDPEYIEGSNAVLQRIEYLVQNTMM
jgi:hypothetical protein